MLIFQKMLTLFLLMGVGYFFHIKGWINDTNSNLLSKIVINVANPAMIIAAGIDSGTTLSNRILLITAAAAVLFYAALVVTAPLVTRFLRIPLSVRGTYQYMYVFGNIGFMGIPLITSVYGTEYALLVAIYNFVFMILMYTYGINLYQKEALRNAGAEDAAPPAAHDEPAWKKIINAGTVGCLIALVCFLTKVPVPDFLGSTVEMLSNLAGPLSMFVIGSSLAAIRPKDLISDLHLNLFILVRLIVIPVISVGIVSLFDPGELLLRVFYVMISVPFASTCVLMAEEYGGSRETAARGVALSTLLSVITLPMIGVIFGM